MWIRDFSSKKVADYLSSEHKKACIVFLHSLADTVSFMPVYESLKKKFDNVEFSINLNPEFVNIFRGIVTVDESQFDYVFEISYFGDLFSRHPKSKNQICCENELGIEYSEDLAFRNFSGALESPFIAVDFVSTIDDAVMGCSRDKAQQICEAIKNCGFIPIDVHFDSSEKISEYYSYSFIPASFAKEINGSPEKLVSVLKACCGYFGVIGDSFIVAKHLLENNCFSISNGVEPSIYLLPKTVHLGINLNDVDFALKTEELIRMYLVFTGNIDFARGIVRQTYGNDVDLSKVKVKIIDNGREEEIEIKPFSRSILRKNNVVYV